MTETVGYKINPKKKDILKKLKKQVRYCDKLNDDYERKHNEIRRLVIYLKEILNNTPSRKIGDTDILSILSNLEDLPDIDNAQLIANQEDLQRKIEEQERWKKNVDDRIIPSIESKLGVTINKGTLPNRNNLGSDNGIIKKTLKSIGTRLSYAKEKATEKALEGSKGLRNKITKKLSYTKKKALEGSKSLRNKITKKLSYTKKKALEGSKSLGSKISNTKGRVKKYMNNRKKKKALKGIKTVMLGKKKKKSMTNTIKGIGSKISKKLSNIKQYVKKKKIN
jgi:hypothetical protein